MEDHAKYGGCEPHSKEAFVLENVPGGGCGIAVDHKPAKDEHLAEGRGGAFEGLEDTHDPRRRPRRADHWRLVPDALDDCGGAHGQLSRNGGYWSVTRRNA